MILIIIIMNSCTPVSVLELYRKDYHTMQEQMIYGESIPFEQVIGRLKPYKKKSEIVIKAFRSSSISILNAPLLSMNRRLAFCICLYQKEQAKLGGLSHCLPAKVTHGISDIHFFSPSSNPFQDPIYSVPPCACFFQSLRVHHN